MFVKLVLISALAAVAYSQTPAYVTSTYGYGAAPTAAPVVAYSAAPAVVAPSYSVAYTAPKVVAPAYSYAPAVAYHAAVPAVKTYVPVAHEEIDPNPAYTFSYGVSDPHTGDHKSASESLVNGVVEGHYSLTEPDGSVRTVKYVADKINGFNAVVEKTAAKVAVPTYQVHAPVVAHAPVVSYASPYSYLHKRATPIKS